MFAAISPVASWMKEVDTALNDRTGTLMNPQLLHGFPAKGLLFGVEITSKRRGGLRKSDEATAFKRKLMRRPIALRGDTKFIPPHMLGGIVLPYVQDVPGPQVAGLCQMLHESIRQPLELSSMSVTVLQVVPRNHRQVLGCGGHSMLLRSNCSAVAGART